MDITLFLEEHIREWTTIYVWLSGWVDSMVMRDILTVYAKEKNTISLVVLHYNHNQRWEREAQSEEKMIRAYTEPYTCIVWTYRWTLSDERSLRDARYAFFYDSIREQWEWVLFLGHHLDDRIETTLLHMMRGASMSWVYNMRLFISPTYDQSVLWVLWVARPLLDYTKKDIYTYADLHAIPYAEDSTNNQPEVSLRNKMRSTVLPFFVEHAHGQWWAKRYDSWRRLYESEDSFSFFPCFHSIPERYTHDVEYILESKKRLNHTEVRRYLSYLSLLHELSAQKVDDIVSFLSSSSSWYIYIRGVHCMIAHDCLYWIKAPREWWKEVEIDEQVALSAWQKEYTLWESNYIVDSSYPEWSVLRYPKEWDRYKWTTRKRWAAKKKIPLFFRSIIPIVSHKNNVLDICLEQCDRIYPHL